MDGNVGPITREPGSLDVALGRIVGATLPSECIEARAANQRLTAAAQRSHSRGFGDCERNPAKNFAFPERNLRRSRDGATSDGATAGGRGTAPGCAHLRARGQVQVSGDQAGGLRGLPGGHEGLQEREVRCQRRPKRRSTVAFLTRRFCAQTPPAKRAPPRPARRSDTPEVVRRVKELLGGHPDLLDGFNCFLPEVRAPPSPDEARMKKTTAALATRVAGGCARANLRARVPPRDLATPADPPVAPRRGFIPRPGGRPDLVRGARVRAARPTAPAAPSFPSISSHSHADALRPASRHPQPYKFNATKDSAAEAANVSDRPRESSPAERIHPSSRSPEVRARAFASRGASRGAARDAGGPKKRAAQPTVPVPISRFSQPQRAGSASRAA